MVEKNGKGINPYDRGQSLAKAGEWESVESPARGWHADDESLFLGQALSAGCGLFAHLFVQTQTPGVSWYLLPVISHRVLIHPDPCTCAVGNPRLATLTKPKGQ